MTFAHAAIGFVLAWYLLLPPMQSSDDVASYKLPPSRWMVQGEYDTERDCQAGLQELHKKAYGYRLDAAADESRDAAALARLDDWYMQIQLYEHARCVNQ